ncbi:MAG: 50S ribosomal protein L13 [Candidatus Paceibacterota bacterium]|jgi:large subunit ribosomal protein L13
MRTTHTIDAQGKKIGRVSSEAAKILMGKNSVSYQDNVVADVEVRVVNVAKADVSGKKMTEKVYSRYSGYPGGLIQKTMQAVVANKGMAEIFRIAIKGMLPKNKLQAKIMKNLVVTE